MYIPRGGCDCWGEDKNLSRLFLTTQAKCKGATTEVANSKIKKCGYLGKAEETQKVCGRGKNIEGLKDSYKR